MTSRRRRAVVVGGGFAGMAAALVLARAGAQVLLAEGRRRLGGRAWSRRDPVTGDVVDNGQHVLTGACGAMTDFLGDLGTVHLLRPQARLRLDLLEAAGETRSLRCPPLPAPLHLAAALLRLRGPGWGERLRALRIGGALRRRQTDAVLDAMSAGAWLRQAGQGERLIRDLWRPLVTAIVNEEPEDASALPLVRALQESFLGTAAASRLLLPSAGLSRLYEPALSERLQRLGGEVRLGFPVVAVSADPPGVAGAAGDRLEADAVVVAVPHASLPPLLPAALRGDGRLQGATSLGFSPIVTVNLWFDRPVMDRPFAGLLGCEAQWAFDRQALAGDVYGHAVAVVYSAARGPAERPPASLAESAAEDLRRRLPAARGARLMHSWVCKERRATFSARPGTDRLRPGARTDAAGIYLAGDWTATGLPATLEGAVRSGMAAAAAALHGWGGAVPPEITRWLPRRTG